MKLTLSRIVNDAHSLGAIAHKSGLPRKMSYALAKNISKIENELRIYNDERQKLLDKYTVKDDNGNNLIDENNQLKIADEHLEAWNKDIKELLEIEVDIDVHMIKLDDFLNGECDLTPAELMIIDYMIEE